ncbi:MAG: ABC transporter ATP-binding protein [Defluviitaleaceae bacterium]|nr:ABC transporter ATP-binding protein [Defluviitaleaceae bacterium]
MLKVEDVHITFEAGTPIEKHALQGVSLSLEQGDYVTIIGGNGAGKSTFLNTTAGTLFPTMGKITVDGVDVTYMPEYKRARYFGRVFQNPRAGTATDMFIEENLALAYRRGKRRSMFRWHISSKERSFFRERLATLGLGLENRLTDKVGLLSGGQRQALSLLMATLIEPRVLLLDEHTAALDPKTAIIVLELTNKLVQEHNLTTLMVTHNMRDALTHGNRIMMMHKGRIILDVKGEEKANLTVADLMKMFETASGEEMLSDRMLLT